MQKQNVTVSIQPVMPETRIAARMATGPRIAASCVSSDMLCEVVRQAVVEGRAGVELTV